MELPDVLLEVQVVDPDPLEPSLVVVNLDVAARDDREVALAGLVPLRQVRIEIGLAEEQGRRLHGAVQGHAREQPLLDDLLVEDGKRAGQPHADGTDVRVRLPARVRGAAAENLGVRLELNVNLDPDDGREGQFLVHFLPLLGHDNQRPPFAIRGEPSSPSRVSPTSRRRSSLHRGPTSCRPTGSPEGEYPVKKDSPGSPAMFTGSV